MATEFGGWSPPSFARGVWITGISDVAPMKIPSWTQRARPLRVLIAAMSRWLPIAAGIALAGCSSTAEPPKAEPNVYPADFKVEVIKAFQLPQDAPSLVRN